MKCLILTDQPGWAYDRIAKALVKFNKDPELQLDVMAIKHNEKKIKGVYLDYDNFLVMGWQTFERVSFLPKSQTMVGVHGHHSWDDKRTMPNKDVDPPDKFLTYLSKFKRVNVVSRRLEALIPNSWYTPNGVDDNIFFGPPRERQEKYVIGCACSKKHDWRKGVAEFILPAARKAGVEVRLAQKNVDSKDMPRYYQRDIDCYVCASSSEGMSLSVLEAAATGLPVISTWPMDNEWGFYYPKRTASAIAGMIKYVKANHKFSTEKYLSRKDRYSWENQAPCWYNFIKGQKHFGYLL